jgi:hypothetical protein
MKYRKLFFKRVNSALLVQSLLGIALLRLKTFTRPSNKLLVQLIHLF